MQFRCLLVGDDLPADSEFFAKKTLSIESQLPWNPGQVRVELQRDGARRAVAQKAANRPRKQGVEDTAAESAESRGSSAAARFVRAVVCAAR